MKFEPFPVKKEWGYELWVANNNRYCGKILHIHKDAASSMHFHVKKHETFCCISGKVKIEVILPDATRKSFVLEPFESLEMEPGIMHRFIGLEESDLMEVSTTHDDNDSYRVTKSVGKFDKETDLFKEGK